MFYRIDRHLMELSPAEKKVAEFIMEFPNDVLLMTAKELSEKLDVSPATISRFCNKVFQKSFAGSKVDIAIYLNDSNKESAAEIIHWATDYTDVPTKIKLNIQKACNSVISANDYSVIKNATDLIAQADTVFLFGVGSSALIARDFQQKLMRIKKKTVFYEDGNFGVLNSNIATTNDLVVAISYSGLTREVLIAARNAKQRGIRILSITGNTKNPLETLAEVSLFVPSIESNESRLGAMFSRYGFLFIVDFLYIGLLSQISESPESITNDYQRLLGVMKER